MNNVKYDIILCGVGGQGVLSLSSVIAKAAMFSGLHVKQSEVHGMAQRGGAVVSHLRLSFSKIYSDIIPYRCAKMILSMEPLESLRYLDYLAEDGALITSNIPVVNIPDYPSLNILFDEIRSIKNSFIIDCKHISEKLKSSKVVNTIMLGAASKFLPLKEDVLIETIKDIFKSKGDAIVNLNIEAFKLAKI